MSAQRYIGHLVFTTESDAVHYWPARATRQLQFVAAVGLVALALATAVFVAIKEPIAQLTETAEPWDMRVALMLVLAAAVLIAVARIYVIHAKVPFVLNLANRVLTHGRRAVMNCSFATAVKVRFHQGGGGEYAGSPEFSVDLIAPNRLRHLPLLEFRQRHDADQSAELFSSFLGLPIVP